MSIEVGMNYYNNCESIDIPLRETEVIQISDDLLLNSNEINYNDNNTYITVHYARNTDFETFDWNDNNFINHDFDDVNYYGENETWANQIILNIGCYYIDLNCNELLYEHSDYNEMAESARIDVSI